ncbi:MAG TPA: tetratricopeptide repeat protein [Candidatus Eremiobacteraceae bacterium]|nr:tetratricopeptide repeat protein [Candidatus Eremiobacteraceae bacterium]
MQIKKLLCAAVIFLLWTCALGASGITADDPLEAALQAYTIGDYADAVKILEAASVAEPNNAEIHLLLAKSYYELEERDRTISSAERAVAIDPQNSVYHEWLGRAYGAKAEHCGWLCALSFAKKSRKEFAAAVDLNERNFSALQALIEFDCTAPGIAGGGDDKAAKEIEKIASLDVAEGHYARGNCRRQKKDFAEADAEFTKALESNPKSADLVYDIGDYAMKRDQADRLLSVVNAGQKLDVRDPRGPFYLAAAHILHGARIAEAEKVIREYLIKVPKRNNYPSPSMAHYWLGRLAESQKSKDSAVSEYETALRLEPKNHYAAESLKRVKKQ